MNRTTANVIVDLTAAFLFLGMIATGYILRFPLPPGTNRVWMLWGLTRHEWGTFHYIISFGLLAVIGLHLLLHWKWIVSIVEKRLWPKSKAKPSMIRSGLTVCAVFAVTFGAFAFAAQWSVREMAEPLHALDANNGQELQESIGASPALGIPESSSQASLWEDVNAVFKQRCISCHGRERQLGGVRIDQSADLFGLDGHEPFVVPGSSDKSPLISIVSGQRPEMRMPDSRRLPEQEVRLLRAWIDAGAER